jgi:hypothetical protein
LLVINEPAEYTCPESLQLSYWQTENGTNRWEDDKKAQFYKYNHTSIATYIPHFTEFTARNTRFTENIVLDVACLDILYDYDFTEIDHAGHTFARSSELYTHPCGWYRKAIRVLGEYGDETWLGTNTANAVKILCNGLLVGGSNGIPVANGAAHGHSIYLSPNPECSDGKTYAKPLLVNDRQYQIMFQVRIKPSAIYKRASNIWTSDNSVDVRPYGILFKERIRHYN